jgi:multicomponent K+:H+ antiporter subunit A
MGAGIIDHECGTRDMRRLAGLWTPMPYTASLAMVAAAAMAGVPLLNGFLSKEMFFAEALALEGHGALQFAVPAAATLAGMFSVAYSARFIHDVFFNGEPKDLPRTPHEPPRWIKVPVEVLVIVCVLVGIFPGQTIGPLLAVAAGAALGGPLPAYSLALWHGVNAPLAMSVVALAGGIALYGGLHRWLNLHTVERGRDGKALFEAALERLVRLAHAVAAGIQRGGLQRFLRLLVLAALAAAAWPFLERGYTAGPVPPTEAGPALWTGWLIGAAGALGTVAFVRERFVALVLLGVVGLMVSLTFVYLSAPDLALTQLLVELVTVILIMLTLRFLPLRSPGEPRPRRRIGDAVLALAAGGGVTALVYAVLTRPFEPISTFFLEKTLPEGGGANAVNVILVDFRGFDTMGEITVLAVAGLVIHALLRGARVRVGEPTPAVAERSALLPLIARLLLPLTVVVSIFLFLRGHNLPGGGFIGGLVLVVAVLIQYIASGSAWVEARVQPQYERWIAVGLLVAGAGGLGSWALGHPFLTSAVLHPVVPVIGEVELASAMVFDLGVYLTVVGASLLALTAIGRLDREGAGVAEP